MVPRPRERYARRMIGISGPHDRPSVLFAGLPQGVALSGVLECEHRGWNASFIDDVVDALDHIDAAPPDVVIVPLSPPHLRLNEFCAVAMRGRRRGHPLLIAWSAAPASPVLAELASRWGVMTCVPDDAGADRICDEIARWFRNRETHAPDVRSDRPHPKRRRTDFPER
jgi:hypothetical protein